MSQKQSPDEVKVDVTQVSLTVEEREQESFKVGCRLVEIIKSLVSSGATRWTEGEGGLGLGASDSRQKRCNVCIVQIKSVE